MKNFFLKFFIVLTITILTSFGFFINKNIHAQQLYCQQGYTLQGNLCVSNLPFLPSVAPTTTPPPSVLLNNSGSSEYSETGYTPLAQLPGLETLDFEADCPLADYINIVTEILIGIIVVICVVKLVLGGLEYITSESISGKANGKESIINGFAGLIIALSAYIVLNTINPTLLNLCPEIKNKSLTAEDIPQKAINGYYGNGKYKANDPWDDKIGKKATLPVGVGLNNKECEYIGESNCTSTRGLDTSVINKIASECAKTNNKNCNITITGGTENWLHSANGTHRPGSSTIDLSPTADVNKYITGNSNPPKSELQKTKDGITYYYHKNSVGDGYHWHVYK